MASIGETLRNFGKVLTNPKFMLFLLIFSGYWIVYWQEFITLPLYVHDYINPQANTEKMLATGPIIVIALTVAVSVLTKRVAAFRAVLLGTLISMVAFAVIAIHPTVTACYVALVIVALGELTQQPRYYDYISRLAPSGQQGTYMGFAFLPLGIGCVRSRAHRRGAAPLLRRSATPAAAILVGDHRHRRSHHAAAVDL